VCVCARACAPCLHPVCENRLSTCGCPGWSYTTTWTPGQLCQLFWGTGVQGFLPQPCLPLNSFLGLVFPQVTKEEGSWVGAATPMTNSSWNTLEPSSPPLP
jgi:hypothetical protein